MSEAILQMQASPFLMLSIQSLKEGSKIRVSSISLKWPMSKRISIKGRIVAASAAPILKTRTAVHIQRAWEGILMAISKMSNLRLLQKYRTSVRVF